MCGVCTLGVARQTLPERTVSLGASDRELVVGSFVTGSLWSDALIVGAGEGIARRGWMNRVSLGAGRHTVVAG